MTVVLELNSGDTAWMLTSAALVLLMTPGLALFYGGMVRAKSVLNMMMMSFGALALVSVLWVLYGYSVAIADRAKFSTWMIFVGIWVTLVYFPIAHWVFDFTLTDDNDVVTHTGGWIANNLAAIDFAGGTAVHINAGIAALALALVLGKRLGWRKEPMRPHNLTLVMIGAGLLWFGWFGFNAGSAVAANNTASVVWVNTLVATAAAALGWLVTERIRDGHPTSLGAASGVVAGLVAITPACSAVSPVGAILLGAIAGVLCALAVGLKYKLGYDDSLDVVGVHLVGGLWGTLAVGLFASAATTAGVDGLFYGGGVDQLWRQAVGALAVLAFSFVLTLVIGFVIAKGMRFRVAEEDEVTGIDSVVHAETGYDLDSLGGGSGRGAATLGTQAHAVPQDPAGTDRARGMTVTTEGSRA